MTPRAVAIIVCAGVLFYLCVCLGGVLLVHW